MDNPSLDQHCARLRIVVLAMLGGVASLTVVAFLIGGVANSDKNFVQIMGLVLGMLGVGQAMAYVIVRNRVLGRLRRGSPAGPSGPAAPVSAARALHSFVTLTIIGAAMAEGFGFFGAILLLITGTRYFLAAPIIAIFCLLMQIPSRDRLERRLQELGVDLAS